MTSESPMTEACLLQIEWLQGWIERCKHARDTPSILRWFLSQVESYFNDCGERLWEKSTMGKLAIKDDLRVWCLNYNAPFVNLKPSISLLNDAQGLLEAALKECEKELKNER